MKSLRKNADKERSATDHSTRSSRMQYSEIYVMLKGGHSKRSSEVSTAQGREECNRRASCDEDEMKPEDNLRRIGICACA